MTTTLADQLIEILRQAGVQRIYGIVGDSLNPIVDAVRKSGGSAKGGIDFRFTCGTRSRRRSPQPPGPAHRPARRMCRIVRAQATFTSSTGCMATPNRTRRTRPGHRPPTSRAPRSAGFFQEPTLIGSSTSARPTTKWSSPAHQGQRIMHSTIQHALALGGSAWSPSRGLRGTAGGDPAPAPATFRRGILQPDPDSLDALVAAIDAADKVAMFVRPVPGAHDEVVALAERLKAPVGHTLRGKDVIQFDNPYDVGMTGLLGYGAAAQKASRTPTC